MAPPLPPPARPPTPMRGIRVERPALALGGLDDPAPRGIIELMPFVSITRLRVRFWRDMPGFLIQSFHSARQVKRATGNLAVSVLRDTDRAFWTHTVWRDEAAMRSFMRSGVHRRVMARLPDWCDEAALVHWVQDADEPPSWFEAHRRLQQEGQRSRINHPSEAHRDPCAADERRIGVQVIAAARSSPLKRRNPCCCLALDHAGG